MTSRKKNIACLESLWDRQTENTRLNLFPMLELISKTQNARFSHLNCNTKGEFIYNLKLLCKKNYSILYLGFHGSSGVIHLHDKTQINFTELAEMMKDNFSDWIVHFSSCSVFRKKKDLAQFVEDTNVILATGYTRNINWIESSALELILFQAIQRYKNAKIACKGVLSKYPDLVKQTGFCYYPEL